MVDESGFQTEFPGAYDGGIFLLVEQTASNIPLLSYKDLNSKFGQYSNYYNEYAINPYWVIANLRTKGRSDDLLGNVDLNYQIVPWLKATARVSSTLHFGNQQNNDAPVIVSDWAAANRNAVQYSNKPGNVFTSENNTSRINFDYYLSGQYNIMSDLTVNYLAGGALQDNRAKDVSVGGNNLVVPYLFNVAVRSGDANVPLYHAGNYNIESRLYSVYGTVGLN